MYTEILKDRLQFCLDQNKHITFLTGAGISAASGIPTYRGWDGFWTIGSANYTPQEIATYKMFIHSATEVWKWFLYKKSLMYDKEPNASHLLLKQIEDALPYNFALISQNIDGLHRKAGSSTERMHQIHGDFDYVRCSNTSCNKVVPFPENIHLKNRDKNTFTSEEEQLLSCHECGNLMRPHVLFFDEYYNEQHYHVDTVLKISKKTGLLFIIGTSGATTLPQVIAEKVLSKNGYIFEVNLHDSYFSKMLENKKHGFSIRKTSDEFLQELYALLQSLI